MTTKTKEECMYEKCPFCGSVKLNLTPLGFIECRCGCSMPENKWNCQHIKQTIQQQKEEIANLNDRLEQSVDMSVITELNEEVEKKNKIIDELKLKIEAIENDK